jgi:hypothetical protein
MKLVPPFAAIAAYTLLCRLSTGCWNIAVGTCFHSATRALVRSGTDVWWLNLARSQRSNESQRCLMGVRSGLCRPAKFFHTDHRQTISAWTSICAQGYCHAETGKGLPQTVLFLSIHVLCFHAFETANGDPTKIQNAKLLPRSWKHRIV